MQNYLSLYCFSTIAVVSVITLLIVIYISEFIHKGKTLQDFIVAFPGRAGWKWIGIAFLASLVIFIIYDYQNFLEKFLITAFVIAVLLTLDTIRKM